MPHTECAHRQAQTQISNESPPSSCSATRSIRPTGHFWQRRHVARGARASRWDAAYTDTSLHFRRGFLLHITISIHSLKFSLGMSTAARFVSLSVLFASLCPSLQVPVLEVPVLEGEPLLLPLAPFLIVKVNVSALEEQQSGERRVIRKAQTCQGASKTKRGLWVCTCSNSSVIVLGSSCLWNHIMYLVWNLHDCFFRALADRYWALVPWETNTTLCQRARLQCTFGRWAVRLDGESTLSSWELGVCTVFVLPPGSRRWKRVFLWTVSGRTLWSQSGAAVSDDGRARWDTGSSSGIALRTEAQTD